MSDILPINRGRVVPKVMPIIGIDIEDTTWMDEPYVQAETDTLTENLMVWALNHEWKIWAGIIIVLIFWL